MREVVGSSPTATTISQFFSVSSPHKNKRSNPSVTVRDRRQRFIIMRKNGLGTVYQRGKSWVIDFYISGKRIRETIKAAKSESAARAKLTDRRETFLDKMS